MKHQSIFQNVLKKCGYKFFFIDFKQHRRISLQNKKKILYARLKNSNYHYFCPHVVPKKTRNTVYFFSFLFYFFITWSCDSRRGKRKVLCLKNIHILKYTYFKEKIHSVSCLTRSFLCLKIETIWVFAPCHKIALLFSFCTDVLLNPKPNSLFTMREESMDAFNFVFLC